MSISLPENLGNLIAQAQAGSAEAATQVVIACRAPLLAFLRRVMPQPLRPLYDPEHFVFDTLFTICCGHFPPAVLRSPMHCAFISRKSP